MLKSSLNFRVCSEVIRISGIIGESALPNIQVTSTTVRDPAPSKVTEQLMLSGLTLRSYSSVLESFPPLLCVSKGICAQD
ncbi:unnamed protein product [Allacma fusca]|uniref:Uncharacterized protein n=1 Tax=Allacma fusca TaxID=39272 RepID=A0A8J2NXL1_9HEXA|nr:unnamed protein product [Allacma fusca]